VRRHTSGDSNARRSVQQVLQQAASQVQSARLAKVANMVKANNPFEAVLEEIDRMIELIGEEQDKDQENLDFCKSERKENNKNLAKKKANIVSLKKSIDGLTKTINDPKTGLKAQIENTEQALVENTESQTASTKDRTEANLAYQQDIRNLVSAASILTKAIKVLRTYYDDLAQKLADGKALLQEDPKPPQIFEDNSFEGQSSKGNDVIGMLDFILEETNKEEGQAHADEESAQHDFEDLMKELKDEEAKNEKNLAKLQETLADKEKELLDEQADLKATKADKKSIEEYLADIKPGCDFITKNFDLRTENRKTEKGALEKAIGLIKGTPAYKTFASEKHAESLGDCKETCVDAGEEHAKCKACLADVTVPAYCAGHDNVDGC